MQDTNWNKPSRLLQPGPPFSQMVISLLASGFSDGKNQNHRALSLSGLSFIESVPAYDSPMSKFTSGIPLPSTANSLSGQYLIATSDSES